LRWCIWLIVWIALRWCIWLIVWIALIWHRLWHTRVPITGLEEVWINWLWVRNIGLIVWIALRRRIGLIVWIALRRRLNRLPRWRLPRQYRLRLWLWLRVGVWIRRHRLCRVRLKWWRLNWRRCNIYNRYVGVSWLGHKA
jgi:hypothetical protein